MTVTLADQLRRNLARLASAQTRRLIRDGGHVERLTLPSLLDLLSTAVASSRSSAAGDAGGAKSKPPIDLGLVDLLAEIDDVVADACREHGLTVRYRYRDQYGPDREAWDGVPYPVRIVRSHRIVTDGRDVAGNLRQLVPALIAEGGIELVEWWVEQFATWAVRAEAAVGDREEGGATIPLPMSCTECMAEKVTRTEDGETYRTPALVANVRGHELQRVECRVCGAVWERGPSLDDLVGWMLAPRRRRTDALGYDLALGYAPPMFTADDDEDFAAVSA